MHIHSYTHTHIDTYTHILMRVSIHTHTRVNNVVDLVPSNAMKPGGVGFGWLSGWGGGGGWLYIYCMGAKVATNKQATQKPTHTHTQTGSHSAPAPHVNLMTFCARSGRLPPCRVTIIIPCVCGFTMQKYNSARMNCMPPRPPFRRSSVRLLWAHESFILQIFG